MTVFSAGVLSTRDHRLTGQHTNRSAFNAHNRRYNILLGWGDQLRGRVWLTDTSLAIGHLSRVRCYIFYSARSLLDMLIILHETSLQRTGALHLLDKIFTWAWVLNKIILPSGRKRPNRGTMKWKISGAARFQSSREQPLFFHRFLIFSVISYWFP